MQWGHLPLHEVPTAVPHKVRTAVPHKVQIAMVHKVQTAVQHKSANCRLAQSANCRAAQIANCRAAQCKLHSSRDCANSSEQTHHQCSGAAGTERPSFDGLASTLHASGDARRLRMPHHSVERRNIGHPTQISEWKNLKKRVHPWICSCGS